MAEEKPAFSFEEKGSFFRRPAMTGIIIVMAILVVLGTFIIVRDIKQTLTPAEVKGSLQIVWHETRWLDKEVLPRNVTIVPAIAFKLKNTGNRALRYVTLIAVFRFADTKETDDPLGEGGAQLVDKPLAPGEESDSILIKCPFGINATSKKAFIINQKEWRPIRVHLFARVANSSTVQLDSYPISQQIDGLDATASPPGPGMELAPEDVARSLQMVEHDSRWIYKKLGAKEITIVPAFTFKVKNVGSSEQANIVFQGTFVFADPAHQPSQEHVLALRDPLPPGQISEDIDIISPYGYSAVSVEAFKSDPLSWRDVKVRVAARSQAAKFSILGIYPIAQKIVRD